MNLNEIDIHKELKKYFGFNQFKGLQEQVIKSIINQNNTFVIMPTGGGKSLCYQLPALIQEGTAIVVSPLIALMKNQVDAIRSLSSENGIAHVLNSSLTKTEINQVKELLENNDITIHGLRNIPFSLEDAFIGIVQRTENN
jgi:ATP-dependent DNA helicase RecQ